MLDKNALIVLKALNKLAETDSYKVVTVEEIIATINAKISFSNEDIKQIIEFLAKQEYINIKFSEDDTFCYSILPKTKPIVEQTKIHEISTTKTPILNYVFTALAAFIGTMLALFIFYILF